MWRSFGQGGGGPMGGGGGGGILKTVHKAVSAGAGGRGSSQEPFSRSATTHYNNTTTTSPTSRPTYKPSSSDYNPNSLSFSSVNHPNFPNSVSPMSGDEYDDYVFCTCPSMGEVHDAVLSLQQVLDPDSPTSCHNRGLELDWIEPSGSMLLKSHGSESVYDAFRLLQTEPSVQRMVISLSSDKSVWDAVMNNEAVRELRDSVYEANKSISESTEKIESCDDGSFPVSDILNWIFINIKAKVRELVDKITEIVNNLLHDKNSNEESAPFEKNLKSSFMLSVMVLLIVVVSRVNRS